MVVAMGLAALVLVHSQRGEVDYSGEQRACISQRQNNSIHKASPNASMFVESA
jgi:hypothetical protein